MSDTLLKMAWIQYHSAEIVYEHRLEDDLYLNVAGYHLQQAVELALKHILELAGIRYPKTHSISELLAMIPETIQISRSVLITLQDTLTSWEAKTRYIKNYRAEESSLARSFKVIETLLNEAENVQITRVTEEDLILRYIPKEEVNRFRDCIPANIKITEENVHMLAQVYLSSRK